MSTSVPSIQFTPAGVVIPQESDVLAGVQADIDAAFGGGLNPALTTPQGQIATSTAAIIADKNAEIAFMASQVDPQYASGRWQDGIGRIYFMSRIAATATAVTCTLGGLPGTVIPGGSLAQDTSGNTYILSGSVTIGSGGTVTSTWQNLSTGPIPCPAGTLTQVYQAISGWDTITNPADGTMGQNVETQAEFEQRRQASVAANAHGSTASIYAAVADVTGVLDLYVIDNPTGSIVDSGSTNYPLAPHSLYVAVVGGADADIAQAIWSKKDVGCDYNGNTSYTVTDPSPYSYPSPSYPVTFNRPTSTPVLFSVSIKNTSAVPSNITTLVQNAIIAQFTGNNPNIPPARIGSAITAANYYATVLGLAPNLELLGITVGGLAQVVMGIDQAPTISASDITVLLV